jgi:hypothetical protein
MSYSIRYFYIFIFVLFQILNLQAQEEGDEGFLTATFKVTDENKSLLSNVKIIYTDLNTNQVEYKTTTNGKVKIKLRIDRNYLIVVSNPSYYTKTIEVKTEIKEIGYMTAFYSDIDVLLFENCEKDPSRSNILDQPVGRVVYDNYKRKFVYDYSYTERMAGKYMQEYYIRCEQAEKEEELALAKEKRKEEELRAKAEEEEKIRIEAQKAEQRKKEEQERIRIEAEKEAERREKEAQKEKIAAEKEKQKQLEKAEKEAQKKAEEEARIKAKAEAEAKAKAEEEERIRKEAEESAREKAEEDARLKAKAEAEAKAKAEEEERIRKEAEKSAREKAEEDARIKAKAEAEAKAKAEEEERIRKEAEESAREKAEEDARIKAKAEAEAKAKAEEEERIRKEAEESAREKAEEDARIKAKAEAEAKAKAEEEERIRKEAEESAREEAEVAATKKTEKKHAFLHPEDIRKTETFDQTKEFIFLEAKNSWPSELRKYILNPSYRAKAIGTYAYTQQEAKQEFFISDVPELREKFPKQFDEAFGNWDYIVDTYSKY